MRQKIWVAQLRRPQAGAECERERQRDVHLPGRDVRVAAVLAADSAAAVVVVVAPANSA